LEISGYTNEILAAARYLKDHPEAKDDVMDLINQDSKILKTKYNYQVPFGPKILPH